jgi:protein arginine kinase activator
MIRFNVRQTVHSTAGILGPRLLDTPQDGITMNLDGVPAPAGPARPFDADRRAGGAMSRQTSPGRRRSVMKCQKCAKPATFHITDIERGKPREYHFCDEHARQHLTPTEEATDQQPMSELAKKLIVGAPGSSREREPSPADRQACPVCQITFLEFRNSGRLGCPYDYEVFRDELMPLLENIHDETRHSGKVPRRAPRNSQKQTELIQLRNDLKRAVAAEDYEEAARIRDKIKAIEHEQGR